MNRLLLFIAVVALASCKKNDSDPSPKPTEPQHTVLVYMSGENSLASIIGSDFYEMIEGSYQLDDNQHLIAFVDSTGKNNPPHIYEISGGKAKEVYRYDDDFYACDPARFREVIKWTIDNYPADDYALVLWGHATGWAISNDSIAQSRAHRAYGQDWGTDMSSSERWMNIPQMAIALKDLPKFKYIFADCCSFQCLESAYELRDAAEYLIGSPAEIPEWGAPYEKLVPKLFSQSADFYKEICDTYYDHYMDYYNTSYSYNYLSGYSVPLSVIKLGQMENLAQATKKVLTTFSPKYPEELDLNNQPFYFGYASIPVMYDVKSVVHKYAPTADYTEWLSAYNMAVPYQLVSRKWMTVFDVISNRFGLFPTDDSEYGCTSMFFPQSSYTYSYYKYNTRIKQMQWYYSVNWSNYCW